MIIPYRWVVDSRITLLDTVLIRTALPGLVFFSIMMTLILLRPEAVNDEHWTGVRGVIGAGAMMFGLCGGLFL